MFFKIVSLSMLASFAPQHSLALTLSASPLVRHRTPRSPTDVSEFAQCDTSGLLVTGTRSTLHQRPKSAPKYGKPTKKTKKSLVKRKPEERKPAPLVREERERDIPILRMSEGLSLLNRRRRSGFCADDLKTVDTSVRAPVTRNERNGAAVKYTWGAEDVKEDKVRRMQRNLHHADSADHLAMVEQEFSEVVVSQASDM